MPKPAVESQRETLKEEMTSVIEEVRMVIPGAQALFGFQTLAVFNARFEALPEFGRWVYLVALGLLTLAVALLMAPAAYHRLVERGNVSRELIDLSSMLVTVGMIPLMLAFAIDVGVVFLAVSHSAALALCSGFVTGGVLSILWFLFPLAKRRSR